MAPWQPRQDCQWSWICSQLRLEKSSGLTITVDDEGGISTPTLRLYGLLRTRAPLTVRMLTEMREIPVEVRKKPGRA